MVKRLIIRAKNNHLIKSSAIFFIGSMFASFGSYLYQLFMGRMLSVSEYGELQSLLSIFMIIFIPSTAISLVVAKYSSHHHTPEDIGKITALFRLLTKKFIFIGIVIFLVLVLLSGYVATYLQINESSKVMIIAMIFLFIFLASINKGVLQGLQNFKDLSIVTIIETFGKLVFGTLFVWIGFNVYGAVGALVVATIIAYIYSFYPMNKILNQATRKGSVDLVELKDLIRYAWPVFFSLLGVTMFFSLDVILAKHYFSPELAGAYGGISILGRIIFFTAGPLASVLFSVVAKEYKEGKNYHHSFFLSFMVIFSIGISAIFVYFFVPDIIILFLLGKKYAYLGIEKYIGWYAVVITLLSLINLVVNFLLSIKITKCVYAVLAGVVAQYIGITIWHSDIKNIIMVSGVSMFGTLVCLFYFYFLSYRKV